jgi:hypothetical protein
MPLPATVVSQQTIQIGINGPGDVASMYVISGIAQISLTAFAQPNESASQQNTFSAPIGPQLTAAQFRRAIASASIASLSLSGSGGLFEQWDVSSVDAAFNDDSGFVELEFDVSVKVSAGALSNAVTTAGIGFQVFILTT